jgi:hypothetical protein
MNTAVHEISPEEIMAHHDGELTADRAKEVAEHLESCSECSTLMESFDFMERSLANWKAEAVPASLQPPPEGSRGPLPWWRLSAKPLVLAFGTLAVIAAIGAVMIFSHRDQSDQYYVRRIQFAAAKPSTATGSGAGRGVSVDDAAVNAAPRAEKGDQIQNLPMNGRSYTGLDTLTPGVAPDAPMIARSIELQIIVKDFSAVRGELDSVLARHQGYAANLRVSNTDNTARALSASLRIPAPQLAAALNELKSLGRVTGEAQAGEEVTAEHADLIARLKNSRETEIRLQDILRNRTGKVSDVLEVEQEIARVRGEIEQMESELKTLNHRVDFATINLTINEEYKAKISGSAAAIGIRLHNATVAGFQSAASSALGIILWLIEIMPSFLLWSAILALPAWWLWRRTQRAFASAI